MKQSFLWIIFLMNILACSFSSDAIERDKLSKILFDIQQAGTAISYSSSYENWDSAMIDVAQESAMMSILSKYKVTNDDVVRSLNYYKDRPLELEELLKKVKALGDSNSVGKYAY